MGDRNNPIKFGPEWLRNLARERSNNNATAPGPSGTAGVAGATGGQPNSSPARMTQQSVSNMASKVLLAKLRYGREEMLALYESTADAPPELQHIDVLYQARPKPPLALNNTFEDEMRDARNVPPPGSISSNDRFTSGRGANRVNIHADGRGKTRGSYVRQMSAGRGTTGGWHPINARLPGTFALGPEEESNLSITRPWNNNSQHPLPNRNNNEQPDWTNKVFRSKRPGNHTNWRQQHSREDGEEWRAEPGRSRPQPDKWERDWGDRSNQGERQPWTSNRRSWVSGDPHNNDDLPEWAVENAEACGGTFDSSGAFHGYSNDDSNLPKNQEVYPLTRSHTHGSFARQKGAEDGSDEWWSSVKAKKLSPKRFDASDIKFKKPSTGIPEKAGPTSSKAATPRDEPLQEIPEKLPVEKPEATPEPPEGNNSALDTEKFNKNNTFKQQFSESKTFDALMRSDINMEEASDERGNFQSVMIAPNNSLRQKHQNMVPAAEGPKRLSRHEILQMMQANSVHHHNMDMENMIQSPQKSAEESILDELMDMKLDDKEMLPKMSMVSNQQMMSNSSQSGSGMPQGSGMATAANNMSQMQNVPMQQMRLPSPGLTGNHNQGMVMNSHPNMNMAPGMQGMGMQSIGITNSALNASLGLSIGPNMTQAHMPMQGVPPPAMANNMGPAGMQPGLHQGGHGRMPSFPSGVGMPGMPAANMGNRSLFLRQNPANNIQLPSDIPMPNHRAQSNMFPNHGLQHPGNQPQMFGNSMYGNMMHQSNSSVSPGPQNLAEQWYYEDPKKTIQGPFSSKEMYNWYRAGFFSPTLMVRRACEVGMRPLGSYGPLVPFAQMDMMPPFPMSGGFEPRPQQHENMLPPQQGLGGMDVMNIGNMNMSDNSTMDSIQFGSVGLMRNPPFPQPPPMMDSLWGQPSTPTELLWMQQAMQNSRTDARVSNLAMFLWDQQPNTNSNSAIPEDIVKEMKTEDQILAQLRAQSIGTPQNIDPPHNISSPPNLSFIAEPPMAPAASQVPKPDDSYLTNMSVTPNLEELEKLLQKQSLVTTPDVAEPVPVPGPQAKSEKPIKTEQPPPEPVSAKPQNTQNKVAAETKAKPKADVEKAPKKENNSTAKTKTKKSKEEKKEDVAEVKPKEDEVVKVEKKVEEEEKRASSKSKKEEKASVKKEMEKEKKEWIKDGFTIVKGAEKSTNKESKKKADEAKAAEEAERKRKEEEKLAVEEEKKKKQADATKKQQEQQQQRQISESVMKKAPWSAVTNQAMQTTIKEPTLAEIQRLEREKKLEQMKEQQQMMQIIAQQQAAALAREQEMQAGLGWAKKMANNVISPSQSLAEIQAEARKQSAAAAVAAAAAAALAQEEAEIAAPPPTNHVPWASTHNGGGFWDTQPNQPSKPEKAPEPPKVVEPVKTKKKVTSIVLKKEVTPAAEFETWCTTVLASYSAKIDVPTFIGFLRDIESPYDVKDYVKCYLGDTKDSNDFARQFLERRSKMIRVGMITPSDDLCSPAVAVNPRTVSGSDYQEVKGKGKKTKKNKMMKIDARILGFSVTASEDRINVGDIDSV